ncbi:hypothetical protein NE619_12270 [Anaerovorax odorimutans]|uniref:Type II secretion system protein n=1 Tax=Anaerovorax odorimutans TaxID=109327 RepID=A0ABT1RQN4_9FIRM|nr:hypothetical protein [Anaerovorax odorimutans]MCQ4637503.1 hypothetical protein [Anaerovorax odorimutans]
MKKNNSGRSMFLLEIGILLLFFIIAAVVCVTLFVFSGNKNNDANDLSSAVVKAVSVADTIKACKNDLDEARDLLDADDAFTIYYDKDWKTGGEKVYRADVSCREKGLLLTAVISFTRIKDGAVIYRLETKEFLGEELP